MVRHALRFLESRRHRSALNAKQSQMTATNHASIFADAQAALREANIAFAESHPGEGPGRQPVHTVYGGAQLFASDSVPKLGAIALRAMNQYMADSATLGSALGP